MNTASPRIAGKICIVTAFDRNYKLAGSTMFKSIRRHTDCIGVDFKIITDDQEVVNEFGANNCHVVTEEVKARYANVAYSKDLPKEKYHTSWYRYELFDLVGYDRVICIDSDCLCVEDISYLFSEELSQYDLVSVEDHIVSKCFIRFVPELERQGLRFDGLRHRMRENQIDVQPALLVANKSVLDGEWYKKLLHYANTTGFTYSIDEGILNDFIYLNNWKIKLLPLEYDYQDLYQIHCPTLPVPERPVIVHCQESKPFKKKREDIDPRVQRWHDKWWEHYEAHGDKMLVVIMVWNRFGNLKRWLDCWSVCDKGDSELVVIHNLETHNERYEQLCREHGVRYVPRPNHGFDMGAFQDVCRERLPGFPNDWANLLWITDDCIPMCKNFVQHFLAKAKEGFLPCLEISDEIKRHIRTTGFFVTKEISRVLIFPRNPIRDRDDCYVFEHRGFNMYDQIKAMGIEPCMVVPVLKDAPLWDTGCRASLALMKQHEQTFTPLPMPTVQPKSLGVLDDLAIKYKSDKSSRYHNFAEKYDRLLVQYRSAFTKVLEIGVAQGQSLQMWNEYFPSAVIHGVDISAASKTCESLSNRIKFHLMDQGNAAQLKNLEQFGPFDLIIDDGNHFWKEQIVSFDTLFPYVASGGIYIVEDTCTSYWPEYGNHPFNCVDYFKGLVDAVNLSGARGRVPANPPPEFGDWEKGWHRREDCHSNVPSFESIQFMNGFIVIQKRRQ